MQSIGLEEYVAILIDGMKQWRQHYKETAIQPSSSLSTLPSSIFAPGAFATATSAMGFLLGSPKQGRHSPEAKSGSAAGGGEKANSTNAGLHRRIQLDVDVLRVLPH